MKLVRLMVQKSGGCTSWVDVPIIFKVLAPSQVVVTDFWTINRIIIAPFFIVVHIVKVCPYEEVKSQTNRQTKGVGDIFLLGLPGCVTTEMTWISAILGGILTFRKPFMSPTGIIRLPILGGIKQCKLMVILRDFPYWECIVWVGNSSWPLSHGTDDFVWVVFLLWSPKSRFRSGQQKQTHPATANGFNPVSSQEKGKGKGNKGGGRRMEWSVQHHDNWEISSDLFKRLPFLVAKWDAGCVFSHVWLVGCPSELDWKYLLLLQPKRYVKMS